MSRYEAPDEGLTATGFVPSNSAYRPTQGAIRHTEDTEFNDALRARGILPPKASESTEASLQDHNDGGLFDDPLETADLDDDDELLGLEDDIPQSILEQYRANRLQEVKKLQRTRKFGSILPIGRDEYTREITEASKADLDGEAEEFEDLKGKGTGVVCFLWKDSVPESQLMGKLLASLAMCYPSTKFVSIRGDMCIADYPDRNIPTLLIYRRGELVKQIVGMGGNVGLKGMQTTELQLEALLTITDAIDPFLKVQPSIETKQNGRADEESDDEDDRPKRNIRSGRQVTVDDDDEDFDV